MKTEQLSDVASFGAVMLRRRRALGWSQRALSENSGVVQSVVSGVELGKIPAVRADTLLRLAAALGVSLSASFDDDSLDSVGPRWRDVLDDLRWRIVSGEFPPGAQLPTQHDMRVRYAIAGPSLTKIFKALKAEGLITTRVGVGAWVLDQPNP